MNSTVITGYSIEGTGTTHFFTADQRRSAYAAARDMAAMRGKNVPVKVLRKEKPLEAAVEDKRKFLEAEVKPDVQAALNALGPLEPPLEDQRGVGVRNSSGICINVGDLVQVRHGTAKGTVLRFLTADHKPSLVGDKVEFAVVRLIPSGREDEFPIDNLVVLKWAESLEALEAQKKELLDALEVLEDTGYLLEEDREAALEALEAPRVPVPEVYEVTVPVRVIVRVTDDYMSSERPVVANEWSGFFSEAEDNSGVWDVAVQAWGSENRDVVTISEVARVSVRNHLNVAYFK